MERMSESTPNLVPAAPPMSDADQRLWSTLVHIGDIFFHFVPALIGYLLLKDRGTFVHSQTRAALNFQLTVLIGYALGFVTTFIFIGFFVLMAVAVLNVIFSILAGIAANRGEYYEYPLALRFISA
jgi:uncharacterized Tic20 family protein